MVPLADRKAAGRSEFTKSLRTTDRKIADAMAIEQLAEWQRQLKVSKGWKLSVVPLPTPSIDELEQLAVTLAYDGIGKKLADLTATRARQGEEAFQKLKAGLEQAVANMVRQVAARDFSYWEGSAHRALAARGLELSASDPLWRDFLHTLANSQIEACKRGIANIEGRGDGFEPAPSIIQIRDRKRESMALGETVMELFEKYAAQRLKEGRKRTDTIDQDRKVLELFSELTGSDRAMKSITRADVREWRDLLCKLPVNYKKRRDYRDLSMREAAAKAEKDDLKPLSGTSINKYLSTLSPLFSWAATNGYVDHNPCDNLFLDIKKGQNPRPPFSTDQINKILGSPLFTGCAADGREHVPGPLLIDDWRYWVPIACFLSGARISEIAQLWVDDIGQEHGIWFFRIRHDPSRNQSTKSGKGRFSPIHSKLVELGILDFHKRQLERSKKDGNQRLFQDLMPNERGNIGGKPSRFWRDYLKAIEIKDGGDGLGSHSFRHGLADELRLADYLDDELEVALGHNQKTVTSGYGRISQGTVKKLSGMIESVAFEGVNFAPLLAAADARAKLAP